MQQNQLTARRGGSGLGRSTTSPLSPVFSLANLNDSPLAIRASEPSSAWIRPINSPNRSAIRAHSSLCDFFAALDPIGQSLDDVRHAASHIGKVLKIVLSARVNFVA